MKIGGVSVAHPLVLASMEEHTNYCFRRLMKQFGASLVRSERVDAADVARRDRRAMRLLHTAPDESPRAGQISGADPAGMAEAARVIEELGYDQVDLNFECPIRRLLGRGEGGALLADPPAIARIVRQVVRAVSIPVTIKIRTGPDAEHPTAAQVARLAEAEGCAAVELHARSVAQAYLGDSDPDAIGPLKRAVAIPVIAGGGIRQPADALRLLRHSGADAVAIARGCLGNPWIFRQARALLDGGGPVRGPTPVERGRALLQLIEGEFRLYGAPRALRRLPRASCYFAQFLPDFEAFRREVQEVRGLPQFRRLVREHFR